MNTMQALVKREFLENQNGYFRTPLVLCGITILLLFVSLSGLSGGAIQLEEFALSDITSVSEVLERAKAQKGEELPTAIAIAYNVLTMAVWIALPFVIFFSLLGSLYEERRDRSILFWKSMPVADWQEILAKLLMSILGTPIIFLTIAIVGQLIIAVIFSVIVIFQGGPVLELWPLGAMIEGWFALAVHFISYMFWALPIFAWIMLVSAYANRMPFLFAILPPVVLIVLENIFFDSQSLARWLGLHLGGWMEKGMRFTDTIAGPRELHAQSMETVLSAFTYSLGNGHMWLGILVAGALFYGTVELRKRAV